MADGTAIERLGLVFSDGSLTVFTEGTKLAGARAEALSIDENETDPNHFTRVVRLSTQILEELETPAQLRVTETRESCPTCGQRHPVEAAHG